MNQWHDMTQTLLKDTAILTAQNADDEIWTLISTMHGEDVLVDPTGGHTVVDTETPYGVDRSLNDLAVSMIDEWESA